MSIGLALAGMVVLGAVGAWTIAHPDGGYRAVGGAGSGLSPTTRRACGWALVAFAMVFGVWAILDGASG